MKMIAITVSSLLAAPAVAEARPPRGPESITYQAGPCMGGCPIYTVTVRSDGTGTFEGVNFTTVRGRRDFPVTPAQYRAFARHLAPIRPARGIANYNGENCREMVTDSSSVSVTWADRREGRGLNLYYGCDPERNRALARRLSAAPNLLPIQAFIGGSR
jgi:hypothetical protein